MTDAAEPWTALGAAYQRPWNVADRWRAEGGKVVGVLGRDVPRELIVAGGMLPIRLSPLRLDRQGVRYAGRVPEALASQLADNTTLVLGALLEGAVDWIDALVIGRDSELYANLFYAIRELARIGEGEAFPPFAFCDMLRLSTHNASHYNRVRVREFAAEVETWSGRSVSDDLLRAALSADAEIAGLLRGLNRQRVDEGRVSGTRMLIAAGAAQTLPSSRVVDLLGAAVGHAGPPSRRRRRVYVTGSGQDSSETYASLESGDALIVGEDHEWSDTGRDVTRETLDPWNGLVDRYHLGRHGAARSGIAERTCQTARDVKECRADIVLQLIFEHDDAPAWEIPELQRELGTGIPLVTVRSRYGDQVQTSLANAVEGGSLETTRA